MEHEINSFADREGMELATVTLTGVIMIITGWIALVEFDSYPESERIQILQKIKKSPAYILLIAFMPIGIVVTVMGSTVESLSMVVLGTALIILQSIIVSFLIGRRKRWKGIMLFVIVVILGLLIYIT